MANIEGKVAIPKPSIRVSELIILPEEIARTDVMYTNPQGSKPFSSPSLAISLTSKGLFKMDAIPVLTEENSGVLSSHRFIFV